MNILARVFAIAVILFGVYTGIYFVRQARHRIYLHCFLALVASIYYGGGLLVTYWSHSSPELDGLLRSKYIEQGDVAYAMGLVFLFLFILHASCSIYPNATSFDRAAINRTLKAVSQPRVFIMSAVVIFLLELYLVLIDAIGFMGTRTLVGSYRINPLAVTIQPFSFGLMLISGFRLGAKGRNADAAVIALAQSAMISFQGRRYFVIALGLWIFGLFLSGCRWKTTVATVSLSALAVVPAFFLFYALRLTTDEIGDDVSFTTLINRAVEKFGSQNSTGREELAASLAENVYERPFIISYLTALSAAPRKYSGAMGRAILLEASVAIPAVVYEEKDTVLDRGDEQYIAAEFLDLPRFDDEPKTILTTFYTDFREMGIILAPLFLILWCWTLKKCQAIATVSYLQFTIFVIIIYNCVMVEKGFREWFVGLRQAVLLGVLGSLLGLMVNSRARKVFEFKQKVKSIAIDDGKWILHCDE